MEVSGRARVTLGNQEYSFDVKEIKFGLDSHGEEMDEVLFKGGKVYSVGDQSTAFTVPLQSMSPEFIDLITGANTVPGVLCERLTKHPDGSESWVESAVDRFGKRRMRTCYASEWSDYMEAPND